MRLDSFASLSGPTMLFGGTMDPVHNGHILGVELAKDASKSVNVVFIPAHQNPHKVKAPVGSDEQRLELIEIAIKKFPNFYVSAIECSDTGPSFTIDTVRQIKAEAPTLPLRYLIGADQIPNLHKWREFDQLFSLVEMWVIGRNASHALDFIDANTSLSRKVREQLKSRFVAFHVDISATQIRAALASGESENSNAVLNRVPREVISRIRQLHLYGA